MAWRGSRRSPITQLTGRLPHTGPVASNEAYVCLAESIRRRDATAKICVFSEGTPADFGALAGAPGVELLLGGDALETFHHLVTAPHLFISSSTFGLAAAVLATQAKIYTAPVGDFASQLAGCWGECDCPGKRRPCCAPPPDARETLARHDPWARFGLGVEVAAARDPARAAPRRDSGATYCGQRPGYRCRGHGSEKRCHPDASCN